MWNRLVNACDGVGKVVGAVTGLALLLGLVWTFGFFLGLPGQMVSFDASQLASIAPMIAGSGLFILALIFYCFALPALPFVIPSRATNDPAARKAIWTYLVALFALTAAWLGGITGLHAVFHDFQIDALSFFIPSLLAAAAVIAWRELTRQRCHWSVYVRMIVSSVISILSLYTIEVLAGRVALDQTAASPATSFLVVIALLGVAAVLCVATATGNWGAFGAALFVLTFALMILDAKYTLSLPFRAAGYSYQKMTFYVPDDDSQRLDRLAANCKAGITTGAQHAYTFDVIVAFGDQLLVKCTDASALQMKRSEKWSRSITSPSR